MTTPDYPNLLVVTVHEPITGSWEKDRVILEKAAQQPTPASEYYNFAAAIMGLFQQFTYGTPSQPDYPQRIGLLRKVYDELYPIGHFAKLYFTRPENVVVQWVEGNQQHDAIVEYKGEGSNQSDISYLEVTTLQDQEDADELKALSKGPSVTIVTTNSAQKKYDRKIQRLRKVLEKKAGINYPAQTALLIYTDEDRFRQYSVGLAAPQIDKKIGYEATLREFEPSLQKFSHVFIYSQHEIYCAWSPPPKASE